MDLRRDVAREIARIYCRLSPSGIEALSETVSYTHLTLPTILRV